MNPCPPDQVHPEHAPAINGIHETRIRVALPDTAGQIRGGKRTLPIFLLLCLCLLRGSTGTAAEVPTPEDINTVLDAAERMEVRGDPFGAQFEYIRAIRMQVLRAEEGGEDAALYQAHAEATLDHLARLAMDTGESLDAAEVAAWVAERENLPPLLRQRAFWILARLRLRQGDVDAARAASAPLHFLRDWWILGPFDNERGRGLDLPLPPETDGIDLDTPLPGKGRTVEWRHVHGGHPLGRIDLAAYLYPNTEALAYAVLMLHSDRVQPGALRVGSDDSLVVWVNGEELVRDDMERRAVPDQRYPGMELRKGWNQILLKVGQATDAWHFYARLTDPVGHPLDGVRVADTDAEMRTALAAYTPTVPGADTETKAVEASGGALSILAEQARRSSSDARTVYLLGLLLSRRGVFGVHAQADRQLLQRATRLEPDRAMYYLGVAEAADESFKLRPDRDENLKRMAYEKALDIDPHAHAARVGLARYYIDSLENHTSAKEILKEVMAATPQCPPAQWLWAEIQMHYGWTAQAGRTLEGLLRREPGYLPARLLLADFLDTAGTPEQARRNLRMVLQLDATQAEARIALAEMYLEAGDVEEARTLFREGLRVDPYALRVHDALIRMLLKAGRTEEARTAVNAALVVSPHNPELLTRAGDVSLQEGAHPEALAHWEKALRMLPGADAAQRRLAWHAGERLRPTTPIADVGEWVTQNIGDAEAPGGFGFWNLLTERVHEVHGDGTRRETYQRVIRILTPEGAQAMGRFPIWYDGDLEQVEVHHARVLHPDGSLHEGTVIPIPREGDRQVTLVTFPRIDVGDLVHLEFSRNQRRQSFFGDYFGSIHPFRQYEPTRIARYALIHPDVESHRFHIHYTAGASPPPPPGHGTPGHPEKHAALDADTVLDTVPVADPSKDPNRDSSGGSNRNSGVGEERDALGDLAMTHTDQVDEDGIRTRAWVMRDLPAIEPEPFMPPIRELSPTVQVSTFGDWDGLARWYWHLIRSQNQSSPEIRRHVQSLTAGMKTDREKVAAIFDWVTREVRNNEWEFGVHGFKPYSADVIFHRRFGDCKDKATLINVMARELGLDAWPVLIYATDSSQLAAGRGKEDLTLPLLNHFNHCISMIHVDGERLFLDGTVLYRTIDSIPMNDAGGEALIVRPDGGERVRLPDTTPERLRWEEETELTPAADGIVDMRQDAVASGHAAVYMRAWFGNPRAWDHVIRALGRQHFGTVSAGTVEDFDATGAGADQTRLQYRLRLRDLAHPDERSLRLPLPGVLVAGDVTKGFPFPGAWMEFAPVSRRGTDLVLPATYSLRRTIRILRPDGYILRNKLHDIREEHPFGSLSVTYAEVGGTLTITYDFTILQRRIPTAAYPAFRRMLHAADRLSHMELLLEKE